ncbi:hypothetical protein LEP1GSC047_2394 [Leptospira inadai serovar Lyme str. 10]|uniref:Uncharacterized protein n=1 Tax=Leptospira inadai serovar Lyme str. 10 TaxID=1049790 RepID=V6HDW0_9LEPT|nr:hypothetical protein LEP1GSC047_2394 [Leptospira inadai serovar Lyme str. 10]
MRWAERIAVRTGDQVRLADRMMGPFHPYFGFRFSSLRNCHCSSLLDKVVLRL